MVLVNMVKIGVNTHTRHKITSTTTITISNIPFVLSSIKNSNLAYNN